MKSLWNETVKFDRREKLNSNITADVLIIGAGITGILCAYKLGKNGVNCVILEAGRICSGQTENTTAKITSQHADIYHKLLKSVGKDKTREYYEFNQKAIDEFEKIIREENINCHFERLPSYLYCTEDDNLIFKEKLAYDGLGIKHSLVKETELPIKINSALKLDSQAQFNPLEFLLPISKKVKIFENSPVKKIENHCAYCGDYKVKFGKVIFACHFPFVNFPGLYFSKMHQERSYVAGFENAQKLSSMYYGVENSGLSFRSYGDLLLLGGGSHRTGKNENGGKFEMLQKKGSEIYKNAKAKYFWSAQDCITGDQIPYIGQFSKLHKDFFVATGFNKWGMSSSMVAATILSESVISGVNRQTVFSPQRNLNFDVFGEILIDSASAVKNIASPIFTFTGENKKELEKGKGAVCKIGSKKTAVFKDENGKEHSISCRCPHLGCELKWNGDDEVWECPCHGSRLSVSGEILTEPAQKSVKKFEK